MERRLDLLERQIMLLDGGNISINPEKSRFYSETKSMMEDGNLPKRKLASLSKAFSGINRFF